MIHYMMNKNVWKTRHNGLAVAVHFLNGIKGNFDKIEGVIYEILNLIFQKNMI